MSRANMAKRSTSRDLETAKSFLGGRPIVLVGLMGAGKTSIGRRLAEKMGLSFVDADHEIEAAAGKSIADIFADHGEAYFRDGERKVIARLMENGEQVLATGGGAYMNPETRARIKEGGLSIWLKADLDLLWQRVRHKTTRPLLRTADPKATLAGLLQARTPFYSQADLAVEAEAGLSVEAMAAKVIAALAEHGDVGR